MIYSSSSFACSMGGYVLRSSYDEFERALETRIAILECLRFVSFVPFSFFLRSNRFFELYGNGRLVAPKTYFTRRSIRLSETDTEENHIEFQEINN